MSPQMDIPQSLWWVANATLDLRLPSQLWSTALASSSALISNPAEDRRLRCPERLAVDKAVSSMQGGEKPRPIYASNYPKSKSK